MLNCLSVVFAGISALFSVLGAIGIVLAARQLFLTAWNTGQDIFTDPDFAASRGNVFRCLDGTSSCSKGDAYNVCRKMDQLARLAPSLSVLPVWPWDSGETKAIETWGDPIAKSWHLLQDFVKEERARIRSKWARTKWKAFQDLGEKAINRLPPEERDDLENKPGAKVV